MAPLRVTIVPVPSDEGVTVPEMFQPGIRVTVAVTTPAGSVTLVAVTVAIVCCPIDGGAVYNPDADTVPAEAAHVTSVVPGINAVNCWV